MRTPALILVALFVTGSALAAEKVYRWTDPNGTVHYSDRPSAHSQEVLLKAGGGVVPATEASDAKAEASAALCEQKTKQLAAYKQAPSVTETDALGKQREYTPAEIKQLIERTQQQKDAACGPQPETAEETPAEEATETTEEAAPAAYPATGTSEAPAESATQ